MTTDVNDALDVYPTVGGETQFAYTFPIEPASAPNQHELKVETRESGPVTLLVEGVDYSVTGAGNPSGGQVVLDTGVYPTGAPANQTWTITRTIPVDRDTDFQTLGDFFAVEVNTQLDRLTRISQDIQRDQNLSIHLPSGGGLFGVEFPLPGAGEFIKWNDSGTQLVSTPVVNIGTAVGVDETDTDATKNKMTSNFLAKKSEDTAQCINGVQVPGFVNKMQATNALAGVNPILEMVGTDTDIGLDFKMKGDGFLNLTGIVAQAQGVDIASAAALDITGARGNYFNITGTANITSITSQRAGMDFMATFTGNLTIVHNPVSLILPTGDNINVVPGDTALFVSLGSGNWRMAAITLASGQPLAGASVLRGHIDGLITSINGTDAVNDIDIAPGECADSTSSFVMALKTAGITKRIDANWTQGTDQGGFPSALTLTNDTWYYLFLLFDPITGDVDAGWDINLAATNLLADSGAFTHFRRIGSTYRAVGVNQLYTQRKEWFYWHAPPTIVDPPTGSLTLLTPPLVECLAQLIQDVNTPNFTAGFCTMRPNVGSSGLSTGGGFQGSGTASGDTGEFVGTVLVMTDTSSAIHAINSTGNTLRISLIGYKDYRGRE